MAGAARWWILVQVVMPAPVAAHSPVQQRPLGRCPGLREDVRAVVQRRAATIADHKLRSTKTAERLEPAPQKLDLGGIVGAVDRALVGGCGLVPAPEAS